MHPESDPQNRKGYKPIMPTFQGLVSEEQLNALVAYIKSLGQPGRSKLPVAASLRPAHSLRRHRCIEL